MKKNKRHKKFWEDKITFSSCVWEAHLNWINFYGVELPKPASARFKLASGGRIIGDKRK